MLVLRNQDDKIAGFSDGKEMCKVMFLNTLAITDRVMGRAIDKSKNGYTEEDSKGKTDRTYPEAVLESVKNHIQKFPVMQSHYVRLKI